MLLVITDIVFGIHARGSAVDIPPLFRNLEIGSCKRPPHFPDTKWYCIVVGGWNSYIRIINKPVGVLSSKLRHLQLLGYKPVIVSYISWVMLLHDPFMVQMKLLSVLSHLCNFRFHGLNGSHSLWRNKKSTLRRRYGRNVKRKRPVQ
jgi:hypothetical protein